MLFRSADAVRDPSALNIAAATIGLVPDVGEVVARGMKIAKDGEVVAKDATKVVEKTASGKRVGDFTRGQKNAAKAENAAANGGQLSCAECGRPVRSVGNEKGAPTPSDQAQIHHDPAFQNGGGRDSKAIVVCPQCHVDLHNQ